MLGALWPSRVALAVFIDLHEILGLVGLGFRGLGSRGLGFRVWFFFERSLTEDITIRRQFACLYSAGSRTLRVHVPKRETLWPRSAYVGIA